MSEWLRFADLTADHLKSKLVNVLTNPSFKNKVTLRSKLLRDQPEKPIARAVWWIEYLLRNPDASHMRVPTIDLGFIRSNSLDLYIILFLILSSVLFSILYVLIKLCKPSGGTDKKMKTN